MTNIVTLGVTTEIKRIHRVVAEIHRVVTRYIARFFNPLYMRADPPNRTPPPPPPPIKYFRYSFRNTEQLPYIIYRLVFFVFNYHGSQYSTTPASYPLTKGLPITIAISTFTNEKPSISNTCPATTSTNCRLLQFHHTDVNIQMIPRSLPGCSRMDRRGVWINLLYSSEGWLATHGQITWNMG